MPTATAPKTTTKAKAKAKPLGTDMSAYERALAVVPNGKRTVVETKKRTTAPKPTAKAKTPVNKWNLAPRDLRSYGDDMRFMSKACPTCDAKKGAACTEPAGVRAPHAARIKAVNSIS